MDPIAASDARIADPRLAPLEGAPTPALLVGADGRIVWTNDAGRSLGAGSQLDAASARAVASLGGSGLLRLRLGAAGRFEPLAFQGGRIDVDGDIDAGAPASCSRRFRRRRAGAGRRRRSPRIPVRSRCPRPPSRPWPMMRRPRERLRTSVLSRRPPLS